jgi:hypothetical protein
MHFVDPTWKQVVLRNGHGAEMAGIALYADLEDAISRKGPVRLAHRLESVKFLPDSGSNSDPELWGAVTAQAVDRPEIQAADRPRVFMMAVTAETPVPRPPQDERGEDGKPTAWSATLDALSFGREVDQTKPGFTYLDRTQPLHPRLIIVSAGNIRDLNASDDPLDRSDTEPVEDPAQAWNALTVGAYTDRTNMAGTDSMFDGYTPVAPRGELSPVSRTSVTFDNKKWPFKPEVVAEGGNWAFTPDRTSVDTPDTLGVLTTRLMQTGSGLFTVSRDTSAATAQVAAIAGDIQAAYPSFRPETIRGLLVHSAEWTDAMTAHFPNDKGGRGALLRRYGMGVPNLQRAIHSASDALTLVVESSLHPYEREGSRETGKTREANIHALPWPIEALEELDTAIVRLRVTLSYFIEPNPSNRGWNGRYAYPSHGLRFAMKRPEDTFDNFRKRVNKKAREEGESLPSRTTEKGWFFGSDLQQAPGSLHTDIWQGTAQDLAAKSAIEVYPVGGWWKNRAQLDQSNVGVNYSLIVSIESPEVPADLWTPVAQMVESQVTIG